jgi:catechol 2,3-dioxygenase-like lactoylglutathione lyase family enzyme
MSDPIGWERDMFSHVMVGTNDMEASKTFYDATLGVIGVPQGMFDDASGRVYYFAPTGIFALTKPINGEPACPANGGTIGFAVASPEQADAWHAAGVAAGGVACEDPPGVRGNLYLAYLRDPAGNKLCALHQIPA